MRLRYWREKAGLTREELAQKYGIDPSGVRHWECGDNRPRDLGRFVEICGTDMQRFWSPMKTRAAG